MELNREMLVAEFRSLIHIAKFTDNDFITSPFRREFLEYALALIKELTRKLECANLEIECKERICESYALQYGTVADKEVWLKKERSDTVRKMLQRIKDDAVSISLLSNPPKFMLEIREDALDQIAKDMLEGNTASDNKCVACGDIIPEGRQVCPNCEEGEKRK